MNRLTIDLSSMPPGEFHNVSSIVLTLPDDIRSVTAARLSTALNGRLAPSNNLPHVVIIQVPGASCVDQMDVSEATKHFVRNASPLDATFVTINDSINNLNASVKQINDAMCEMTDEIEELLELKQSVEARGVDQQGSG